MLGLWIYAAVLQKIAELVSRAAHGCVRDGVVKAKKLMAFESFGWMHVWGDMPILEFHLRNDMTNDFSQIAIDILPQI